MIRSNAVEIETLSTVHLPLTSNSALDPLKFYKLQQISVHPVLLPLQSLGCLRGLPPHGLDHLLHALRLPALPRGLRHLRGQHPLPSQIQLDTQVSTAQYGLYTKMA